MHSISPLDDVKSEYAILEKNRKEPHLPKALEYYNRIMGFYTSKLLKEQVFQMACSFNLSLFPTSYVVLLRSSHALSLESKQEYNHLPGCTPFCCGIL